MTAYLFPGQGSQTAGMAKDLYDAFPEARARLDEADDVLGFSLTAAMFGEGEDAATALTQTDITQPALYAHSLAAVAVLEARGMTPGMTAGHSLGEYSALAAAGALSFADGMRIVRLRGRLMAEAGQDRAGTMAAILGMDAADLEATCADASTQAEVVVAANYNAPSQIVVSGDVAAVERACALATERGAKRAVMLPVSGAFHSPLVAPAAEGLAEALGALEIVPPRCPVYLNVTAAPTQEPSEIRRRLLEQLTAPVRWAQTLEAMQAGGAETFAEVGTGRVLSGLVKRTLGRRTPTQNYGTAADFV
jgi:[acyl-carrier-protein] S-malonyltransferase